MKTAVVEREHLGGICLNWGCIPTKALLRSADVFRDARRARAIRARQSPASVGFDAARIVKRSRDASARLNAGVAFLLKKNKIDVIWGEATIAGTGEVRVGAPTKAAQCCRNRRAPKATLGEGVYQRQTHHRRDRRPAARSARP